jgi:hypothetical protein
VESYGYRLKRALLTVFGDIKIFPGPLWIVYHPRTFRIKGAETRHISSLIEPGDVVMRAYTSYLDGYFIPKGESKCSHSGLYVGDGLVVHSIAEGAQEIDLIDFCRTDRIVVLRPGRGQEWAVQHAEKCADKAIPYDFDFAPGPGKYYCHELTASCFPELDIQPLSRKILGFVNSPVAYLADSFYTNPNFQVVYETDGGVVKP